MKSILITLAYTISAVCGAIHADGVGFSPVIVQVVEEGSGTPIKNVRVHMEDLEPYREMDLDPERHTKILPDQLGKVITTNEAGVAVVFIFSRWGSFTNNNQTTYSRSLVGTVVVEHDGKQLFKKSLKAWAEENKFKADAVAAPWILVTIPKRK